MAGLKFTIHPLFFIFGLYFAVTGKVFSFLAFTFSAVIHELGHYYASERYGYSLNKIVLMPYGAIIKGDALDLKYKDEIIIALAGPFINICTWLFCASLWWIIPDSYPYTELMATSSLALFVINLLPCYPLDGGRVLLATLSLFLDRKKAKKIAKVISVTFAIALIILFIYSLFVAVNISLLLFAVFILAGAFSFGGSDYVKTYSSVYLGVKTYKTINLQPLHT
jgi:stage IV sporulation protein FB